MISEHINSRVCVRACVCLSVCPAGVVVGGVVYEYMRIYIYRHGNNSNRYVYTYTDIYIYILKSLQTCQQSHKAKHGGGGRWPPLPKGLAPASRPAPTLLALHVLQNDFEDMSEDSLVCICICLCMYIRICYYYYYPPLTTSPPHHI